MKTRLVRIGNSQGIRIPKILLEQTGLCGEVELTVRDKALIIKAGTKPRADWAAAFDAMAREGDDQLLDDAPTPTAWDEDEWEW